jgi:uncharacterized protein VcgC/VcgE DUF2780
MSAELVSTLQRQLGVTREQAEGGAGVMLQFARDRLAPDEFRLIADTVEAVSDLIGKAPVPVRDESDRLRGWLHNWLVALRAWWGRLVRGEIWLWRWTGGLGPLASLSADFESMGLPKSMLAPFAAEAISYFRGRGGDEPERLLERVLR